MTLALIDRFPGAARLAHVPLCSLPTPLEPFALGIEGASLMIKRDDLTSSAYGGNKVRKLEFLLGDALARGARAVITFGAYGSNHALATAVHARNLGLEPHVVLSPQPPTPYAAATLRAHVSIGSVLHPVEGWDGARTAVRLRDRLAERDGVEPTVIPMGGTSGLGALGYVNAALEIVEQADVDVVYVAAGTLGTAVGLALGFVAASSAAKVVAVRVTPEHLADRERARALCEKTVALLTGVDGRFPRVRFEELELDLRDDWYEPGYGVVTPEAVAAVERAADAGIGLETTYSGKALAALVSDAEAGRLEGERVLFVDTYSSASLPPPGPVEALPDVLQGYVQECERLFGASSVGA